MLTQSAVDGLPRLAQVDATDNPAYIPGRLEAAGDLAQLSREGLVRPEGPVRFFLPEEILFGQTGLSPAKQSLLEAVMHWMREFITRPHPQLGRKGAVCPYVKPAMNQRKIWVGVLETGSSEVLLGSNLLACASALERLMARGKAREPLDSLVLVLPDLPDDPARMEPLHQALKTQLLARGLMLGQFYPSCPVGGTYNADFRPLRAPAPMFVLRALIESDWRFVAGHPEWERLYHARMQG